MSISINAFYEYGQRIDAPEHVLALAQRILAEAEARHGINRIGSANLSLHAESINAYRYDYWSLTLFSINTGLGAEMLDYSNASYLEEYFSSSHLLNLSSGSETRVGLPLNDDIEALLFPIEPSEEELSASAEAWEELIDALNMAVWFADYPLLDEEDYSRRESEAWNEEVNWLTRTLEPSLSARSEEWQRAFHDSLNNWYGYSEPGDVREEWITEAIEHADKATA